MERRMSLPSWRAIHDSRDGAPGGNADIAFAGRAWVPVAGRKAGGAGDGADAGGVGTRGAGIGPGACGGGARGARSVEIVHGVLLVHCAECCIVSIGEQCFAKPTPVFRLC